MMALFHQWKLQRSLLERKHFGVVSVHVYTWGMFKFPTHLVLGVFTVGFPSLLSTLCWRVSSKSLAAKQGHSQCWD